MSEYLNKIIKINSSDYATLKSNGSITKSGVTYTYDSNNLYLIENNLTDDYVLLGGGGSKKESELSVSYSKTSGACSGNSATATVANSAIGTNLSVDSSTLINAGFLASDYTSRYDTGEFLKAFVKWAQTNYPGRSIFGKLCPNSRGYFFIDCYNSGFNSSTGYPEHCTGRYYPHSGNSYIFGTSYGNWYCYDGISSANIASQSVNYATSAGTATSCSGSAASLATSRTLWGQSFNGSGNVDGTIRITPTTNNWTEGIRIKPYSGNGWTTILLGGTDLSADTGTSANSWSFHTYAGNFFINRNNSNATTPYLLCNVSGNWGMGTNAPAYKLDVQGTLRATGATTLGSSLSVTGDIAASSNVNVTNQTKSKTFNIDGGCTLEYDSTNKCVKFNFS